MTSIDLYDELVKNLDESLLASERESIKSVTNSTADEFQMIVKNCRNIIDQVRQNNGDILRLKDRLFSNVRPQKQSEICQKIKKICDGNFLLITELREKLIKSGSIVEDVKKQSPNQPQTFSKVYRKQHLTEEVDKILNQTFTIQKIVQKFSIQTTLKRIRLILPEITEDEAKKIAQDSRGLQQAVMQRVTGKASLKLKYAHQDILSKAQGIAQLESSVEQNLKLMKQVGILVQQQGQMIDSIFKNVAQAKDYVGRAEIILVKEKQSHKKSRKKIFCIIFIGILILGIILTPIIIKIVKNKQAATTTQTADSSTIDP